eukprot:1581128-Amphidinium_carterae.1
MRCKEAHWGFERFVLQLGTAVEPFRFAFDCTLTEVDRHFQTFATPRVQRFPPSVVSPQDITLKPEISA